MTPRGRVQGGEVAANRIGIATEVHEVVIAAGRVVLVRAVERVVATEVGSGHAPQAEDDREADGGPHHPAHARPAVDRWYRRLDARGRDGHDDVDRFFFTGTTCTS